jgi:flagellar protein FliS
MTQGSLAYRANQAYRGAAVAVPPLRAMVMLYGGAITFLQKSLDAQDARRFEESHDYLMRATAILRGVSHNLDFVRGGAVAEQVYQTHNALILACLRSYGKPHARASFRRIMASLSELREAWVYVDASQSRAARPAPSDSVPRR